jgi:addiction module HigA family antidote
MRDTLVNPENFVGKTIRAMDVGACNTIGFVFTDGSTTTLDVVAIVPGALYGIVEIRPPEPPARPEKYDPIDDDSDSGYRRPSRDPRELIDYLFAIGACEDGGNFIRAEVKALLDAPDTFFVHREAAFRLRVVLHPGVTVIEYLEGRGWTQRDLAQRADLPLSTIAEICAGTAPITPAVAQALRVFERPAHFWLNLQQKFDAFDASRSPGRGP